MKKTLIWFLTESGMNFQSDLFFGLREVRITKKMKIASLQCLKNLKLKLMKNQINAAFKWIATISIPLISHRTYPIFILSS